MSFPLGRRMDGCESAVISVRSHFLEFLPVDSLGELDVNRPRLAHELDCGQRYAVVLTTGGGLFRYQLGDVVEVNGKFQDCPMVRFVGRQGYVSDWFGEKLNEAHVSRTLQSVFDALGISPSFAMLSCETGTASTGYVLFVEAREQDDLLHRAAGRIEASLRENFHYHYARELGQLAAVRVFRAEGAAESWLASGLRNGQRAGGIKPLGLDRRDGWSRAFRGHFLQEERSLTACSGLP